jgi:hypothetical protein
MIHEKVPDFFLSTTIHCPLWLRRLIHRSNSAFLRRYNTVRNFPEFTENKKKSAEKSINHQNTISLTENGMEEVTRLMDSVES